MRTRTVVSTAIAAWAIALPMVAGATVGADPQQEETVEPQKPTMAEPEESVELQKPPEAKVVIGIPPLKVPPVIPLPLGTTTTIFVVRHAEKELSPPYCENDTWDQDWSVPPCLTAEGMARAQQLLQILKLLEPSKEIAVYSTKTNRTWQTAQPTAEFFGVDISLYPDRIPKDFEDLANEIRREQIGKKVLVVSHSGLLRHVVKNLGAPEGSCRVPPDEFDNLCIVGLSGAAFAGFARLRYEVLAPRPDLVIETLLRQPTRPQAGDTVTFTATVRNAGTASAGACKLSLKASWKNLPQISDLPALAPGQSHSVEYQASGAVAGRQHVVAEVDLHGSVQESDESNNKRSSSFTVLPRDDDRLPPGVKCRTASDCGPIQLWNCCEPGTRASFCVRKPRLCP